MKVSALRRAGRILLAASLVFLGWSGWTYWRADGPVPADRQLALTTGTRAIATLNTLDAARPQLSLDQWLASTSGPLHDQLKRDGVAAGAQAKNKISATGTVLAAALTSFDGAAGTARLIASVNVQQTPQQGAPTVQRQRFEAAVTRSADGWKLTSLTAVPVGAR